MNENTKTCTKCKINKIITEFAGFTELDPNTETVIGFWPMYKNQAPKIIKRLQLLK